VDREAGVPEREIQLGDRNVTPMGFARRRGRRQMVYVRPPPRVRGGGVTLRRGANQVQQGDDGSELHARVRSRLGQIVRGKYCLTRVIGVGGMAAVYAAQHRNGKEFAVKMLHPELSASSEMRRRFLREGYLANRVKHRGAVSVIDDDVAEDGAAFLVMELLELGFRPYAAVSKARNPRRREGLAG
jgi:hypothetical protein